MTGTEEGRLNVEGGSIWYQIVGKDRPGIPLLTLHGGPGMTHDYLEPLEGLSDERPVIFYDQLGSGRSDRPEDLSLWNIPRFVGELSTLIDALDLGRVHLLGQSWGTMLACQYMLDRRPDNIVSLVLSGPALSSERFADGARSYLPELPAEARKAIDEAESSGNFDSPGYLNAVDLFYHKHVCRLDPWPDCLDRSISGMGRPVYLSTWGPSEFTVTGSLRDFDITGQLREITAPVLFTCGELDEATPDATRYYQLQKPGSEMTVFAGASHCHHLEVPSQYLTVVRDFLRRTERR